MAVLVFLQQNNSTFSVFDLFRSGKTKTASPVNQTEPENQLFSQVLYHFISLFIQEVRQSEDYCGTLDAKSGLTVIKL